MPATETRDFDSPYAEPTGVKKPSQAEGEREAPGEEKKADKEKLFDGLLKPLLKEEAFLFVVCCSLFVVPVWGSVVQMADDRRCNELRAWAQVQRVWASSAGGGGARLRAVFWAVRS